MVEELRFLCLYGAAVFLGVHIQKKLDEGIEFDCGPVSVLPVQIVGGIGAEVQGGSRKDVGIEGVQQDETPFETAHRIAHRTVVILPVNCMDEQRGIGYHIVHGEHFRE